MTTIEIKVSKSQVMNEVEKTTSYVGQKMMGEGDNYKRIFTADEDRIMLERFWIEACDGATGALRHYIIYTEQQEMSHGADLSNDYSILLGMPLHFDDALTGTMNNILFSYFVNSILSKWFMITNKDEAAGYATAAEGMLENVRGMLWHRKRPQRSAVQVIANDAYTPTATSGASQNDFPGAPTGPLT